MVHGLSIFIVTKFYSWAFAGASVMQDRLCIATRGKIKEVLSPLHLMSCRKDIVRDYCDGSSMDMSFIVAEYGVLQEDCYPYRLDKKNKLKYSPSCSRTKCDNYVTKRKEYQISKIRELRTEREILTEIYTNGPVLTHMLVHDDFFNLGEHEVPYFPTVRETKGWHSVHLVGWGNYNGIPFYHAVNSWGSHSWGNSGYFKIKVRV